MKDIVSAKDLAALIGIRPQGVSELAQREIVKRVGRGRYDLAASVQGYCSHLRETAAGRASAGDLDLAQERAALAREQRIGHELKNEEAKKRLIDAEDAKRAWSDVLRKIRSRVMAVSSRVRQKLPHLDASEVDVIDGEIRDALEGLASGDA